MTADDCNLNATVAYMKAKANNEQDYDSGWWLIGRKWDAMELLLSTDWTPDRDSQFEVLLKEVTVLTKAHTESKKPSTA